MAFDALRLRNVIQLVGILRAYRLTSPNDALVGDPQSMYSVFHAALMVMAALQVHETRTALVLNPKADWTTDYVVCVSRRIVDLAAHLSQGGGGAGTLWQGVLPFLIVAPVVIAVSWLVMMWFVRELYYEFG